MDNAPQVGEKLALKVDEFLQTGRIKEAGMLSGRCLLATFRADRLKYADDLQHNERYQALKSLMTVHGIGHHTAKELYALGYRSAEDLRKSGKWETEFKYHDDIQLPCVVSLHVSESRLRPLSLCRHSIPRADVESIAAFVQLQIDRIERGAHICIAGG